MMGEALERKGTFLNERPAAPEGEGRFAGLVGRLKEESSSTEEQIRKTLRFSWEKGNLIQTQDNGRIRWEWVTYL